MNHLKAFAVTAVAGFLFAATTPATQAQISVNVGVAPECPYGYYDYAPYACAPYGYYGPEWFHSGVFVGAGPWFHGPKDFHGHVDNHFDPHKGYRGPAPRAGDKADRADRAPKEFKGNEVRDGRGHAGGEKR